jgi:prefoldin subunit 5
MKDWIEKVFDFLVDVIKFLSPVSFVLFLLNKYCEKRKTEKKAENLKKIIFEELTQFLSASISYSLKCYMFEFCERKIYLLPIYALGYQLESLKRVKNHPFYIPSNRDIIETIKRIEERIMELKKQIKYLAEPILSNRKRFMDETLGWIFALNNKYEKDFPEQIVKNIKEIQESLENFYNRLEELYNKLEELPEGVIDVEFFDDFRRKWCSIKPEVADIPFKLLESITQKLTELEDFDNEFHKEVIDILSDVEKLSNKKSKYSNPSFCIGFVEEVKSLVFKIDKLLEKERANL